MQRQISLAYGNSASVSHNGTSFYYEGPTKKHFLFKNTHLDEAEFSWQQENKVEVKVFNK